jgi:hypothetical protein
VSIETVPRADRYAEAAGRTVLVLAMCLLAILLVWSSAKAADLGEWVPGLKLTPFLSEKVGYETNIFQVPSHSQGDTIFRTIPGFVADYSFGRHAFSLGYRAEFLNYVKLTSQDTVNQIAAAQLILDYPRTLINIKEDFVRTNDPPGTELAGPVLSSTNTLAPRAEYNLTSRFSVGVNASWLYQEFDDGSIGQLIDRNEYLVGTSVFWKILPKSDISLNYYYGWTRFTHSTDRDYTSNTVTVALRGEITPKLSSTARYGYTVQTADHAGQVAYSGWITGGDWVYTPTERTTIVLSTLRSTQASTDGINPYYVTTSGILSATQLLLPKLSLGARIGGGINDYPDKDTINGKTAWRQDTFTLGGGQLDYNIQPWLRVGLEYLRTARTSNFNSFNFVDERISGHVTVQY